METFAGRSVCGERKEDGQTMTPFQRFPLFLRCSSVRRESATLQNCSVALFVEWKKGREIGTMRWCVPCTAIRWGSRNAVVEKVVVLVRVARANAEERGERVGAPRCGTETKLRLPDVQSGREAMS